MWIFTTSFTKWRIKEASENFNVKKIRAIAKEHFTGYAGFVDAIAPVHIWWMKMLKGLETLSNGGRLLRLYNISIWVYLYSTPSHKV